MIVRESWNIIFAQYFSMDMWEKWYNIYADFFFISKKVHTMFVVTFFVMVVRETKYND